MLVVFVSCSSWIRKDSCFFDVSQSVFEVHQPKQFALVVGTDWLLS